MKYIKSKIYFIVGKEVVNRITTKLSSQNEFFTDANDRQILKRKFGIHGNSLNINITDPVKPFVLNKALPLNINVLTLDLRSDGKYLLRLEHPYDVGEDTELSKPVMLNLSEVIKTK